jgi:UDP:flavonoid glycosyltransferase YjiC (YdhE family)
MAMDAPLPDPLPHILLVSLPAPGHLFPFTSFAYQLAAAGAQVTLLTTGYVFEHLQHRGDHKYKPTSSGSSSSSNARVRFEGLMESTKEVHEVTLKHMLNWMLPLSDDEMGAALERRFLELRPRPCCIVADMFIGWAQDVANKLHVPRHTLFTMPAKDLALIIMVTHFHQSHLALQLK